MTGVGILVATAWLSAAPATGQSKVPGYEPGEEKAEDFPAGAGREETFYACIACHNFKLIAAQRLTRNGWDETITLMAQKHNMPAVEGDERKVILDYLSTAFAPDPSQQRGWKNPFSQ
jgi:hypothetical protein